MHKLEDLRVLPQGGHGYIAVKAIAIEDQPEKKGGIHLLVSLDEGENLVFWDINSGKQVAEISLFNILQRQASGISIKPRLDTTFNENGANLDEETIQRIKPTNSAIVPDQLDLVDEKLIGFIKYDKESTFEHPNENKIISNATLPYRLLIEGNILYAYGKNALFTFDIRAIKRLNIRPKEIIYLGKLTELPLRAGWENENKKVPSGFWGLTPCKLGTLSAQRKHYLCIYFDLEGHNYLSIYNLKDLKRLEIDPPPNVKAKAIHALAYNEETSKLSMVYTDEADTVKADFFKLTENWEIELEQSLSISATFWLNEQADRIVWIESEGDFRTLRQGGSNLRPNFKHEKTKIGGPIYQLDVVTTPNGEHYILNTKFEIRFCVIAENKIKTPFKVVQPSDKANKYFLMASNTKNRMYATVSGWLKSDKTSIQPSNGILYLGDFEKKVLIRRFNTPRPKINQINLVRGAIEHNLDAAKAEYLNVFMDNGSILSLQLGGKFSLKMKYDPEDFKLRAFDLVSNPTRDMLSILSYKNNKTKEKIADQGSAKLLSDKNIPFPELEEGFRLRKAVFSPKGDLFAIASEDIRIKFYKCKEQELEEFFSFTWPKKEDAKFDYDFYTMSFHPSLPILALGLYSKNSRCAIVTVIKFDDSILLKPVIDLIFLPQSTEYSLQFSDGGKYLSFHTLGKVNLYEVKKKANSITIDAQINYFKPENKVNMYYYARFNNLFRATMNSPVFLDNDNLVLVERKEGERIEIWKTTAIKKALKEDALPQDNKGLVHSINTVDILYSSFLVMKEQPIIIFYRINDEWLQLVNWKTGERLATFFPFSNRQFLIMSYNNYYYTGPDGYDLAAFELNGEVFPMEQFDLIANQPGLVFDRIGLSGEETSATYQKAVEKRVDKIIEARMDYLEDLLPTGVSKFDLGDFINKPFKKTILSNEFSLPTIETEEIPRTKENKLKRYEYMFLAKVRSTNLDERLTRFNVFVNGVPLYGKDGISLQWGKVAKYVDNAKMELSKCNNYLNLIPKLEDGKLQYEFYVKLNLSDGTNKIQVAILNMNGIETYETFYVEFSRSSKPQLHFIGIAVDKFSPEHADKNLNRPVKDMRKLIRKLKDLNGGEIGEEHPDFRVSTLPEMDSDGKFIQEDPTAPTRDEIIQFLTEKKKELSLSSRAGGAQVDDRVILYFGGHGLRDDKGELLLASSDMDFNNLTFSATNPNGLHYEEVEDFLDGLAQRNKLFILDACGSGEGDVSGNQTAQDQEARRNITELFNLMKRSFIDLRRQTGATIISASLSDQEATEGILVNGILKWIRENEIEWERENKKGILKIEDLADHLMRKGPQKFIEKTLKKKLRGPNFDNLRMILQKEINNLIALELSRDRLEEELNILMEKHNEAMAGRRAELIAAIMEGLQQPTLRAINLYNDWVIGTKQPKQNAST